jgi:glycogen phosphorylase
MGSSAGARLRVWPIATRSASPNPGVACNETGPSLHCRTFLASTGCSPRRHEEEWTLDATALRHALLYLAANHRWTWNRSCRRLLQALPGSAPDRHPFAVVSALTQEDCDGLLQDDDFVSDLQRELDDLDDVMRGSLPPQIAYCSPEFGLTSLVPQYAGGLGILAGDHLKASSDLGVPIAGVSLWYRDGYFTQRITGGRQSEDYQPTTPADVGATDTGIVVEVPFPDRTVTAGVWRLDVGRIPLVFLDTDLEANSEADRTIGDRLYSGDRRHRLDQEMVLGVGSGRALAALGWDIQVHHLNEGHPGFLIFELVDRVIEGGDLAAAVETVGKGLVFTTHTPVPEGIDRFARKLITPYLASWAERWAVPANQVWALGRDPLDPDMFNMAALCLRVASEANCVSQLHGEVGRTIFAGVGCGDQLTYVTNGVHARTWVGAEAERAFDAEAGTAWDEGDPAAWDRVAGMDEGTLGELRRAQSGRLAELVAATTGDVVDPDGLIVGFARRFAPYKRATLLLRHRDRLLALLNDDERPVHFVFAGKAHPLDDRGKGLVAQIVAFANSSDSNGRLTFIPGYDMAVAAAMVQGCDVWLNTPIRPQEASGTSGEKAALNGVLQCSILDGWWAEMYDGQNGWAIPGSDRGDEQRDDEESLAAFDVIDAILEDYFADRAAFNARIRHAWRTLGPRVTAARMVAQYRDEIYAPALQRVAAAAR